MRVCVRRAVRIAAAAACTAAAGCGVSEPTIAPGEIASKVAVNYMNAALDIMQFHSINRYEIDWPSFRVAALERITGARTTADTYPGLTATVAALGDHHSSFFAPGKAPDRSPAATGVLGTSSCPFPCVDPTIQVTGVLVGDIGYVSIPGFTESGAAATAFAGNIQSFVKTLDASLPCGWIIDLRYDTGGNMWPMLAGVGPLLGNGDAGAFVDPDSVRSTWFYDNGAAGVRASDGTRSTAVQVANPYTPSHPMPPVALIYSTGTASAGEAVAIAFRGRPLTYTVGRSTAGLSTANIPITLSDGAVLNLTEAADVDRTGIVYGGKLVPDATVTPTSRDPAVDAASQTAVAWLHQQVACGGSGGV